MNTKRNIFAGSAFQKSAKGPPNIQLNQPLVPVSSTGEIGVELEMEGRNFKRGREFAEATQTKTGRQWTTHDDNSLRGECVEYVFGTPSSLDESIDLVQNLFSYLHTAGTVINHSNRTSSHVHINVQGMKVNELTSFAALWFIFEEALINWCGETRTKNLFCLSNKDADCSSKFLEALQNGRFQFSNDHKYAALNFGAFSRFGSFEFRCFRGADGPEPLISWIKFLLALKNEAINVYQNPSDISVHCSEIQAIGIFQRICDKAGIPEFFREVVQHPANAAFQHMCFEGFRKVQPILFAYPWAELMPEIQKPFTPNPFGKQKKQSVSDIWAEMPPAFNTRPQDGLLAVDDVPLRPMEIRIPMPRAALNFEDN